MKLQYQRGGVPHVSDVISWGVFPVPVPVRSGILSPGNDRQMGIALSAWALVAEIDAARGCRVPVVVPIDGACELVE